MNGTLKRLGEIRKSIKALYQEKSELESELIKGLLEKGEKSVMITENEHLDLVWVFDKKIDYDRLKANYPDIYELGLITSFSSKQALLSMDKELWDAVLRDCLTLDPHYEVKKRKKKGTWKRK
jgi:predicted phage-related endonuclease